MDQGFPDEEVGFGDGARGDAVGGGLGEEFVFVEEAFGGEGGGHCVGWLGGQRGVAILVGEMVMEVEKGLVVVDGGFLGWL